MIKSLHANINDKNIEKIIKPDFISDQENLDQMLNTVCLTHK